MRVIILIGLMMLAGCSDSGEDYVCMSKYELSAHARNEAKAIYDRNLLLEDEVSRLKDHNRRLTEDLAGRNIGDCTSIEMKKIPAGTIAYITVPFSAEYYDCRGHLFKKNSAGELVPVNK